MRVNTNGIVRIVPAALVAGICFLCAAGSSAKELSCASAESMDNLMNTWTHGFTAQHADEPARVTFRSKFSAEAFDALIRGDVQVAPFARELFPGECTRYLGKFGAPPLLVPIAIGSRATKGGTHAIAIFVHEKNPLTHLSLVQLREILARDGALTTWGQLGLVGEWADRKIALHGMVTRRETGNPPGIVNFLETRLLAGRSWRDNLEQHVDVPGGPQALEQVVRAIAADDAALGYSGFAYAVGGAKSLALAETETGPFFAGTADEVARKDYPLAREIYLCISHAPDEATREFVRYVLSAEAQGAISLDAQHFFPLNENEKTKALQQITSALPSDRSSPLNEQRPIAFPSAAKYLTREGAIAIVGYNDMREMIEALNLRFASMHAGFAFASTLNGTRTGPPALAQGTSAFAPMGAEFSPRERADYRAATGSEPLVIRIAHASLDPHALSGPLAIFVHKDNPLVSLTMAEVAAIFMGESVSPEHIFEPCGLGPETALGIFFQHRALGGRMFDKKFLAFRQSADVVARVGANPHAIGFAAANRSNPAVKQLALALEGNELPVALTTGTIESGRYPLDRFLLIAARQPLEPWLREYLRFVLSHEGQRIIAAGTLGYLPLNASELADESAKLD